MAAASRSLPLSVGLTLTPSFWKSFETTNFWHFHGFVIGSFLQLISTTSCSIATADYLSTLSLSSTSLGSDSEMTGLDNAVWSSAVELKKGDSKGTLSKVPIPNNNHDNTIYMHYCGPLITPFSVGVRERSWSDSASLQSAGEKTHSCQ